MMKIGFQEGLEETGVERRAWVVVRGRIRQETQSVVKVGTYSFLQVHCYQY